MDRLVGWILGAALAWLAAMAFHVSSFWWPALRVASGLGSMVWWGSLLALVGLPIVGHELIQQVCQRRRHLAEELQLTRWYRPRRWSELLDPRSKKPSAAISPQRNGAFRLGTSRWKWCDLNSNCIVFGAVGSGKTVCVMNGVLEALIAAPDGELPPSLMVLDPKGDFRGKLRSLCGRLGREHDLITIDPERPQASAHWNPFDSDDDEYELASRFAAVLEMLGKRDADSFWIDSAKNFMAQAIALLRWTNSDYDLPSFVQLHQLLRADETIYERLERLVDTSETVRIRDYFERIWFPMAAEQRSGIATHLDNMLAPFVVEPYATIFSGRSTWTTQQVIDQGKILYLDMPVASREHMARVVGTFLKLDYFRAVLKNLDKPRRTAFFCDEFQHFFTAGHQKGDADTFERTRQSNHANVIATQNLPALLKNGDTKHAASNLLGNCQTRVFLRNHDIETNQFAATTFGQHLVAMRSTSPGAARRFGIAEPQAAQNDQYDFLVRPERFQDLVTPSREEGIEYADAIIFFGGRSLIDRGGRKDRLRVHPL